MKTRNDFFNHIAKTWDDGREETGESLQRVVKHACIREGDNVLDVGTGTGVLLPYLAEKTGGSGQVYAIDYAEKMMDELKKNKFPPNVKAELADIHETHYGDEFFDRVVANACYPHFEDKARALTEIRRILKPGGLFILSHPTGREHVNRIHRNAHELVLHDILPEPEELLAFVAPNGYKALKLVDEAEFFLMKCERM